MLKTNQKVHIPVLPSEKNKSADSNQRRLSEIEGESSSEFFIEEQIHNQRDHHYGFKAHPKKQRKSIVTKKLIQNCRRTARIIVISQLSEMIKEGSDLANQLESILLKFTKSTKMLIDERNRRNIKYFSSLNYSRIRICQKQFVKRIVNNPRFQYTLKRIFLKKDSLLESKLIRRNKRGTTSLEIRKDIISNVLEEYQKLTDSVDNKKKLSDTIIDNSKIFNSNTPLPLPTPLLIPTQNSISQFTNLDNGIYRQNIENSVWSEVDRQNYDQWIQGVFQHFWACQLFFRPIKKYFVGSPKDTSI